VIVAALLVATSACAGGARRGSEGEILVFAASSLTESFAAIGGSFERAYPLARVRFNFGPSDGLANGIEQGARADVFASASETTMDVVARSPGVVGRSVFARNRLVVIAPKDSTRVAAFADLAVPGVKLVVAAASVPAGKYARQALDQGGLHAALRNIVSNEVDVKSVVQKVVLGEADAGIVYATDVTPTVAARVRTVPIPDAYNVIASYPIARVKGTRYEALAGAFEAYVLGPGQDALRAAGFLPSS